MTKRLLAVLMAVLTAALCCSVGLADDAEKGGLDRGLIADYVFIPYGDANCLFDMRDSSSSLLWAKAVHGGTSKKLRFHFRIGEMANGELVVCNSNSYITITTTNNYTAEYAKSYTVAQVKAKTGIVDIPADGGFFIDCDYKLYLDNNIVGTISRTYYP